MSLQDKLDSFGSAVAMMRNSQTGPYVHPIPAELSNWRDEQMAWREAVALMDQYVEGPLVERHVQMAVRATVAAWPFSKLAQQSYRK